MAPQFSKPPFGSSANYVYYGVNTHKYTSPIEYVSVDFPQGVPLPVIYEFITPINGLFLVTWGYNST